MLGLVKFRLGLVHPYFLAIFWQNVSERLTEHIAEKLRSIGWISLYWHFNTFVMLKTTNILQLLKPTECNFLALKRPILAGIRL